MSQRKSDVNREDRVDDEASLNYNNELAGEGASGAEAPPPFAAAHALHLFNLANQATSAERHEPATQPMDAFQQLQSFLEQAQQLVPPFQQQHQQQAAPPPPAPPPPQPRPAATQQHPQQSQQQMQDAIPMLMNALLASQSPTTPPSSMELNQTLLLAMAQLVQYRNLALFLLQLLTQTLGPLPLQMLLVTMGGFPPGSMPPLPTLGQSPQSGMPFLAALSQGLAAQQAAGAESTNRSQQITPSVLSQFQNFLRQMGGVVAPVSGSSTSSSNMPAAQMNPMAFVASQAPLAPTIGVDYSGNAEIAAAAPAAAAAGARRPPSDEPPIPLPVRKKRKYDHENFPEKLHRLIRDAQENGNEDIVKFSNDGSRFQILNCQAFEEKYLPQYFRHNRISSFKRLLRMYNFRRIQGTWMEGIFEHPLFHRDHSDWCKQMQREE